MLTGKQKSFLRSEAHSFQPIIQVGKAIVTEATIETVVKALEARELIKVSVLQNCLAEPKEVAEAIADHSGAEIVQVIGRTVVLFKQSSKKANRDISVRMP